MSANNQQNNWANHIQMIMSMGFNQQQAQNALLQAQGNFDYAIEFLTTGQMPQPQNIAR